MFADDVHPTPYENWLIARYVLEKMAEKGWL
jgi:phospholipase/lecithinase/hemolysin